MSNFKRIPIETLLTRHKALVSPATSAMLNDIVQVMNEREMNLTNLLNGGLSFFDNFAGEIVSFTTNATPDTQDTVAHGLIQAPSYFFVVDIDKAGILYRSASFDKTNVYLKCSVASASVKVFIF